MTMKRLCRIFVLLVFVVLSDADEANEEPISSCNQQSCTNTKLVYMFKNCGCEGMDLTALLEVNARKENSKEPRVSLTSLLDVSGSMSGEMDLLHNTNKFLVDSLSSRAEPHKFGSIKFSTYANPLTPLELLTPSSAKRADEMIDSTTSGGSTDLFAGIEMAFEQQKEDTGNDADVRAVFIFTDGQINTDKGITDEGEIIRRIEAMVTERPDIAFYTFALRTNVNDKLLRRISNVGRGTFSIILNDEQMACAFGKAIGGVESEVGKVKFTITPEPGVIIKSALPDELVSEAGDSTIVVVDLKDLQKEERRSAVLKIHLDNGCVLPEPLKVQGECKDTGLRCAIQENVDVDLLELDKDAPPGCSANNQVIAETLRYEVYEKRLDEAIKAADAKDYLVAADLLDRLLFDVEDAQLDNEEEWMVKAKKDINQLIDDLRGMTNQLNPDVLMLDDMYAVRDSIVKQRTGSTNENFESVGYVTTTAKTAMITSAKRQVAHIIPASPFTFSVSEAVSQKTTDGGLHYVDVMYTLEAQSIKEDRPPLSLTVAVDTSQSMSADAIKILVDTLKRLVEWITSKKEANVRLGVITFGDTVKELLALSKLSAIDISEVEKSFDAIQASGTAKIEEALTKSINQQRLKASCTGYKAVFLLSNSASSSSSDSIVKTLQAQLDASDPVYVYTFALKDSDTVQMGEIAAAGNGQKYILQSPNDIPYSFGDAIGGLIGVSAKSIKVQFTPTDKDVKIASVFPGGEPQGQQGPFNASTLNVFEEEEIKFLVSVCFPESSSPASLLSISTSYTNVSTCGIANSEVASIGAGEKSPTTIDRRRSERDVASKLKEAADVCMNATDLEVIKNISNKALYIADKATETDYRISLVSDVADIIFALADVKKGTKSRSDVCAQLNALIDLLESERSKGTGKNNFYISKYYDSEIRKKSREEMAEGVVSTTACKEWTSAASQLQAQIRAWNGNTDATSPYCLYTKSTEHCVVTSMHDEIGSIFQSDVTEEQDSVAAALMQTFTRIKDAIGRDDFLMAMNEASAALQRVKEFPCNREHVTDAFAWHLIVRSKNLVESVQARCSEGHGSVAQQLDFMVDEAVKDKEVKPWMETEGSAWGAISFAY